MFKRLTLATVLIMGLATAAPALAAEPATLTLRSGERVSGDLWDLYAQGFRIRVNGEDRDIPTDQVAFIEFEHRPGAIDRTRATAGETFVLMKNGDVLAARLTDIGGTAPLRLTVQTPTGERDLTSAEVAVIHLAPVAGAPPRSTAAAPGSAPITGSRTFAVAGTRPWTATNIHVEPGQVVNISSNGAVRLSAGGKDMATAAGLNQPIGSDAPMPGAPRGALIGRIDNHGEPFLIGDRRTVTMPATGTLQLGINDDVVSDNAGELRVTVSSGNTRSGIFR